MKDSKSQNARSAASATTVVCPLCGSREYELDREWQAYRMLACSGCGLVYADPLRPPDELYDRAYGDSAHCYHGYVEQGSAIPSGKYHVAWAWRHFFRRAPNRGSLLDVGCSTGIFMAAARSFGWTPQGVEISPIAAAEARRNTGCDVSEGTLDSADLPPGTFDAVTSWEVLEHVPDPNAFAGEVARILKPGGYWAVSTPNWNSPWERATTEITRRPPYHVTYWTPGTIVRLLQNAGFDVAAVAQKPVAWQEEVGSRKWLYLPISVFRSLILGHKGNRLFALGRKTS